MESLGQALSGQNQIDIYQVMHAVRAGENLSWSELFFSKSLAKRFL